MNKMKNYSIENIPPEVWNVKWIQHLGEPVGQQTYAKIQEVIAKYPQYFPWEHKYALIPQEVHEAFQNECYPDRFNYTLPDQSNVPEAGFESQIKAQSIPYTYPSDKSFQQLFQEMIDAEEKRRRDEAKELKRCQTIWNKHYQKYGLSYRP